MGFKLQLKWRHIMYDIFSAAHSIQRITRLQKWYARRCFRRPYLAQSPPKMCSKCTKQKPTRPGGAFLDLFTISIMTTFLKPSVAFVKAHPTTHVFCILCKFLIRENVSHLHCSSPSRIIRSLHSSRRDAGWWLPVKNPP